MCPFKWKLFSNTFLWRGLLCCTTWFKIWVCARMKSLSVSIPMKATWAVVLVECVASLLIYEPNDKLKSCVHLFTSHPTLLTFVSLMPVVSLPDKANALERGRFSLLHWLDVSSKGETNKQTNKQILFQFEKNEKMRKRVTEKKTKTKHY